MMVHKVLANLMRNVGIIFILLLIAGCVKEPTYRGVSAQQWRNLTSEQKQLIVDKAYEEEINGIK